MGVDATMSLRLPVSELRETMDRLSIAAGVDDAQRETLVDCLSWCDMVGRINHGIYRLPILLERVLQGGITCPPNTRFTTVGAAAEKLEAGYCFGHHASVLAIERACDIAEENGIGMVGVSQSNFLGANGYFVELAARRNMLAIVLSNSVPKVAAPGALHRSLGTNPVAFGAPRRDGRTIIADMSTASSAGSSIRTAKLKGEPLPVGIAIDREGNPIRDPAKLDEGFLLSAAGAKGFGLSIMVETLCSVLTGASMSTQVNSMYDEPAKGGGNGHFMLAIDIARWLPLDEYFDRIDMLARMVTGGDGDTDARLPGDARWSELETSLERGVKVEDHSIRSVARIAKKLGVQVDWIEHAEA